MDVGDALGVDKHVVEIEQAQVRTIAGDDLLDLQIDRAALRLIDLATSLIDQLIHFGIVVKAAVESLGRKARAVKYSLKDVWIFVPSNPPQRIDLEGAFDDVGIEGREFKGADLERDA